MKETKIGVVEDEILIADSICSVLKGMNYTVLEPATDYDEAIQLLKNKNPDLLLLDINLNDPQHDGIELGHYIKAHYHLPFIFLTANSDAATLAKAKMVNPNAFLVKPFVQAELYAAIEIAMHNFYGACEKERSYTDHIFIKDGTNKVRIMYDEIQYIESDHVYVSIHTVSRRFLVRASLEEFLGRLDKKIFHRIHRSYVVNIQKVSSVSTSGATVGPVLLPVSKRYREEFTRLF